MDELRRLNYLDAMGIEQWVARQPLPFAKRSEFEDFQSHSGSVQEDAREQPNEIARTVDRGLAAAGQNSESLAGRDALEEPIEEVSGEIAGSSLAKTNAVKQATAKAYVEVHGRKGLYVLLVEKRNEQLLSKEESQLLANLLKAIDSLFTDASVCTQVRESFHWPMFGQQAQLQHLDVSEQAMEDALNAFVSALLKRHQQGLLLVLGDSLGKRVRPPSGNVVLLSAASLASLLQDASLKATLWHELLGALG